MTSLRHNRFGRWAGIAGLSLLTACAHARNYPICLYDTGLAAAKRSEADWPTLRAQMTKAAVLVTGDPADVVMVTSRSAVIRTTRKQDARLQSIWPAIACYGESSGTQSLQVLDACMKWVRSQIGKGIGAVPSGESTPPCQTVREGGKPGS